MLKAILFDYMGVLLLKRKNYRPNKLVDEVDAIISQVTDDKKFKKETKLKYKLTEEQFNRILRKIVNKYEKNRKLWQLLPKLKKKYKLAIINNGTALTLKDLEKKHHFSKYFDLFISSGREGIKKPDKKIFLLTCKRLKVKPKECIFIDDVKSYTKTARELGMQGIVFKDPKSMKRLVILTRKKNE